MAGGFPVGMRFNSFPGSNSGNSNGIQVTPSATANTTGAWVEMIPSLSRASSWMMVTIQDAGTASVQVSLAVSIAVGALGSEVPVIQNMVFQRDATASVKGNAGVYFLPAAFPSGTRISANSQAGNASAAGAYVSVLPFDDAFGSVGSSGAIDTYGFSTSTTTGVSIDPGATINTKGAYFEITSGLSYGISGFVLGFDAGSTTSGSNSLSWTLDVAVGSLGSEVIIVPDIQVYGRGISTTYKSIYPAATPFIPVRIPAGTRVAIRAQCNTATLAQRPIGVTFYGARL